MIKNGTLSYFNNRSINLSEKFGGELLYDNINEETYKNLKEWEYKIEHLE